MIDRERIKRLVVPYLVAIVVAALCVPIANAVGGPSLLGLPWWMVPVEFGIVMFGLWWAFLRGASRQENQPRKREAP